MRRESRIALGLFIVVSSIYFATLSGITSSNDGSHYALMRAMVDEGRFEIATYAHFAEGNDLARVGERIYSDRPPGTALLAAPFYVAGRVLPPLGKLLPSRHDAENPALLFVMLLPVLAGTLVVVLFYKVLLRWKVRPESALLAALALASGTLHWKYSSVLFSHAPSALLVMLAVWIALHAAWLGGLRIRAGFVLGFVLGMTVLVEYSNLLFVALVLLFLFADVRNLNWRAWWQNGLVLLTGGLIPAAFLAYYNHINFGSPWITSYAYAVNYPWAASLATTFDFPLLDGLRAMLFFSADERFFGHDNQGIFLLSPIVLLAIGGMWYLWQRRTLRREALFILGVAFLYLLLFSKHHTLHGFTGDGRYFAPFIPLLVLPLGLWVDHNLLRDETPGLYELVWLLLFFGLAFLSMRNIAVHIGYSFNYTLDLGQFDTFSTSPENWVRFFSALFPNWRNLPLLWALEAIALGIVWGITKWRARVARNFSS